MPEKSTPNAFKEQGYLIIKEALAQETTAVAARYLTTLYQFHRHLLNHEPDYQAYGRYIDPLAESLLEQLLPNISQHTQLHLLPTYSYLRIYLTGATLPRHTDRPSCEISATLNLGGTAEENWPIHIEHRGQTQAIMLYPGDLMIYRGCDIPHWREQFAGKNWLQIFLHYVDARGPYKDQAFDGRTQLGAPQTRTAPVRDTTRDQANTVNPDRQKTMASLNNSRNALCHCGSGKKFKHCHGQIKAP